VGRRLGLALKLGRGLGESGGEAYASLSRPHETDRDTRESLTLAREG
jgi:hypothetical protein